MPPVLPQGGNLRGRYKIISLLHNNSFCNLYVVQDQHLRGKSWVVKEISVFGYKPEDRARMYALFQAEAYQVSALEHPNLPKLVDFFTQDSNLYLVREFVSGSDLATLLGKRRILQETEILNIGIQLCDVVAYLQSRKFSSASIYKHLKFTNIVVGTDGVIALLDCGFAKLNSFNPSTMRNPDYAAPEQYTGEIIDDSKTLIFNIGALLYHLFTNLNPSSSAFHLPPMDSLRQGLSPATQSIVEKAVQNYASDRPGNISELRRGLDRAYNAAARRSGVSISGSSRTAGQGNTGTPTWVWILGMIMTTLIGASLVVIYQMFFS